jgi:hypothetical protein
MINPFSSRPTPGLPSPSTMPQGDIARQQVDLAMSEHMTQLATNLVNQGLRADKQLLNLLG